MQISKPETPTIGNARLGAQMARTAQRRVLDSAVGPLRTELQECAARVIEDYRKRLNLPDGKLGYEAIRQCGGLSTIDKLTSDLAMAVLHCWFKRLQASRRAAYVGGVQAGQVAIAKLGAQSRCDTRQIALGRRMLESERIRVGMTEAVVSGGAAVIEPPVPQRDGRRLVARIVILDGERLWMVQGEDGERWLCPGGGVERGESMQEGAVREALEETGMLVQVDAYVCDIDDDFTRRRYYLGHRLDGGDGPRFQRTDPDGGSTLSVALVDPHSTSLHGYDVAAIAQATYVRKQLDDVALSGTERP